MSDSQGPIPPNYSLPSAAVKPPARRRSMMRNLRRQGRNLFTLERLREFGTSMALVVPLTLLIWVWAEREQTVESVEMQFIVDVRSVDPTKVMSIVRDGSNSGAVAVALSGPRAGLDAIKDAVKDNSSANRLTLDINEAIEPSAEPFTLAIGSRLNQQKIFEANGVTVKSTTPSTVEVLVDRVVEKELPVKLPPELASRVESAEFVPKSIRVRGPERVMADLEAKGKLVAEIELNNQSQIMSAKPGVDILLEKERIRPIGVAGVNFEVSQITGGKLHMSQEERGVIRSMAVYVAKPAGFEGQDIVSVTPTIANVPVIGPIDVLRKLEADEIQPRPIAVLTISREDRGKTQERLPTFQQLPAGVRVDTQQLVPLRFSVSGADAASDSRPVP